MDIVINVLECPACKNRYETGILSGNGLYAGAIRLIHDETVETEEISPLSLACPNCQTTMVADKVAATTVTDSQGKEQEILFKFPPPESSNLN